MQGTGLLVLLGMGLQFYLMIGSENPPRTAFVFGLAHQLSLQYWLFLLIPAKTIPFQALVQVQAITAILYVSLFYLGWGWVFGRLRGHLSVFNGAAGLLLLPVLWTAMEAARAQGELGYPWCLSGAAFINSPLLWLARSSGEIGLGAGLALGAAFLASVFALRVRLPRARFAAIFLGVANLVCWLGLLIGSQVRLPVIDELDDTNPTLSTVEVAAVQANVSLDIKWNSAKIDSTKIPYAELTQEAAESGAQFVVWAETAMPAYVRYDKPLLNWLRQVVRSNNVHLYTGFPDAERSADGKLIKFNSSGLFSPRGSLLDRYAKYHLLPIGEAMPFTRFIPQLAKIDVGQAEWTPGNSPHPMTVELVEGSFRFSSLICFESAFAQLARKSVASGSQCLVVITNDGWFGQTAGPRQHSALSRMRAAECAVPVIRCANNGISFICDAQGQILDSLDLGKRGFVEATIRPGVTHTVYVKYGAWPLMVFMGLYLAAVVVFLRRGN